MTSRLRGFTLIELLVALMIIALLIAGGMLSFTYAQKLGRDSKRLADLHAIAQALSLYYNAHAYYPWTSASAGTTSVAWSHYTPVDWIAKGVTDAENLTPRFARVLPKDPINSTVYAYVYVAKSGQRSEYYVATLLETKAEEASRDGGVCAGMWYELYTPGARNYGRDVFLAGC